jgi:hypothetical protein
MLVWAQGAVYDRHNHISTMVGDAWTGIECSTQKCGERFSADEYQDFAENRE